MKFLQYQYLKDYTIITLAGELIDFYQKYHGVRFFTLSIDKLTIYE